MITLRNKDGLILLEADAHELSEVCLAGKYLRGAQLAGMNLSGLDLRDANLEEADFQNTNLSGAMLDKSNLSNTNFSKAQMNGASFVSANLSGSNLTGVAAKKAEFKEASMISVIACEADFTGSSFYGTNFRDADLSGAIMRDSYFRWTNVTCSNLSRTDFTDSRGFISAQNYLKGKEEIWPPDFESARVVAGPYFDQKTKWWHLPGGDKWNSVKFSRRWFSVSNLAVWIVSYISVRNTIFRPYISSFTSDILIGLSIAIFIEISISMFCNHCLRLNPAIFYSEERYSENGTRHYPSWIGCIIFGKMFQ